MITAVTSAVSNGASSHLAAWVALGTARTMLFPNAMASVTRNVALWGLWSVTGMV